MTITSPWPQTRPRHWQQELQGPGRLHSSEARIDYRISAEAPFPAQLHDTKAAIRYLRHYAGHLDLDPHRIGIWDESAGGHLAAMAALTGGLPELEGEVGVLGPDSSVRVCVDGYGLSDLDSELDEEPASAEPLEPGLPYDIVGTFLGSHACEAKRAASPITYVTAEAPPFLLLHGTQDIPVTCLRRPWTLAPPSASSPTTPNSASR
ncbi:alpha/beta hydrolase fold domain-containing protein [Streptomyces sp. QTS52]